MGISRQKWYLEGKLNKLLKSKIILTTNTIMQHLFWDSGHCAIKVRITVQMYISMSVNTSIHCLVIILIEICWDVKLFIVKAHLIKRNSFIFWAKIQWNSIFMHFKKLPFSADFMASSATKFTVVLFTGLWLVILQIALAPWALKLFAISIFLISPLMWQYFSVSYFEELLGVGSGQFCLLCRFFLDTHSLLCSSRWNLFGITRWLFPWRRWIYKYAKLINVGTRSYRAPYVHQTSFWRAAILCKKKIV